MRLNSIVANRHIFADQVSGQPIRLQLAFDSGDVLRLRIGSDGDRMIVDGGALDTPEVFGNYGRIDLVDVTKSLFPTLCGIDLSQIEALIRRGKQVGIRLTSQGAEKFHFWVDGDGLHWGMKRILNGIPSAMEQFRRPPPPDRLMSAPLADAVTARCDT